MNILVLAWQTPATSRMPGSPRLFNLCRELAHKHRISLLMMDDAADRRDALLADPETASVFSKIEVLPERGRASGLGRQIHRMRLEPYFSTRWTHPDFFRLVCERVSALSGPGSGAHVILADGLEMTQYVQAPHVPAIAELHDSLSLLMTRAARSTAGVLARLRTRLEGRSMARWERRLRERFACVLTNSDVDAEHIRRLDPRCPVSAISNGVDTRYFSPDPSIEIDPHRIVFTGVMDYEPNVDAAQFLAKEILPLVRRRVPSAECWIVGHSPTRAVQALSALPGVTVTGSVDDVRAHALRGRVFVSPLRFGAGIKNKVLAAMAMGRPVVATSLSLHAIEARSEVEVLIGDTAEQLAAQICRVLEDDELTRDLGEAGRRLVLDRYSWRSRADALERELRAALTEVVEKQV